MKALVYLAAFVPEEGESAQALVEKFSGSTVGESLKPVPLPGGQVDLYIDPRVFHQNFAADVPADEAALFAITQRPAAGAALGEPATGTQAWHTIPCHHLVSGADRIIPPMAQGFMAQRTAGRSTWSRAPRTWSSSPALAPRWPSSRRRHSNDRAQERKRPEMGHVDPRFWYVVVRAVLRRDSRNQSSSWARRANRCAPRSFDSIRARSAAARTSAIGSPRACISLARNRSRKPSA